MIELIFVIVILGLLTAVAIPRMVSVQDDAKAATEKRTIAGVRGGVHTAHVTCMARNLNTNSPTEYGTGNMVTFNADCWPIDLDTQGSGSGATGSTVFSRILRETADGWVEGSTEGEYEGPATGASGVDPSIDSEVNKNRKWKYDNANGSVIITNDS